MGCSMSIQEAQIMAWAGVNRKEGIKESFQEK